MISNAVIIIERCCCCGKKKTPDGNIYCSDACKNKAEMAVSRAELDRRYAVARQRAYGARKKIHFLTVE